MKLKNKMKSKLNDNIIELKISNGHQIWIFKKLVNGYKYIGIYSKKIKMEVNKNGRRMDKSRNRHLDTRRRI